MAKHKLQCGKDIFSDSADPTNSKNPTALGCRYDSSLADNDFDTLKKGYQPRLSPLAKTKSPVLLKPVVEWSKYY